MQTGKMAAEFWHAGQRDTATHIAAAGQNGQSILGKHLSDVQLAACF